MNEIKRWLESEDKDYETGLRLLGKYGRSRALVINLGRKNNAFNQQKLAYELNKIELPADVPKIIIPSPLEQLDVESQNILRRAVDAYTGQDELSILFEQLKINPDDYVNTPEPANAPGAENQGPGLYAQLKQGIAEKSELDLLVQEMQRLFQARVQLSNSLADQQTDEARKEISAQVLAHQEAYNVLAEKRKYFEAHGKFPEVAPPAPAPEETNDKSVLIQLRNNLRSQRTKAKTALEKKPEDVAKQEKLAKIEIELSAVEAKIKLLS